jgi:hypothetical protein
VWRDVGNTNSAANRALQLVLAGEPLIDRALEPAILPALANLSDLRPKVVFNGFTVPDTPAELIPEIRSARLSHSVVGGCSGRRGSDRGRQLL